MTTAEATADHILAAAVREVIAAYRVAIRCGVSLPVTEAAAALTVAGNGAESLLSEAAS